MKFAFSSCAFHLCASTVWNSLDATTLDSQIFSTFKQHFKTHLYNSAFNITPWQAIQLHSDSFLNSALCKLHTNLLTYGPTEYIYQL